VLTLANSDLRLELLDPTTDRARLGPRFCWGGSLWQVHDRHAGPVLTGPEWPKPDPSAWNSQGLPESFRHRTRDGRPLTWQGAEGVALGAGALALDAAGGVTVTRACQWRVAAHADRLVFETDQEAAGRNYALRREIGLTGRTVRSATRLTNRGLAPLHLEWFCHPFFALTDGVIDATLPEGSGLPENPGFALAGRAFTQKRRFAHEQDGHLDFLRLPAGGNLAVRLTHPVLTHVDFETSFAPSECLVWGNSNTFSIEPYQVLDLAPGQTQEWSLRYTFGPVF
jgi:hypothetical protein